MIASWWYRVGPLGDVPPGTRLWGWPVRRAEELDVMPEEYEDRLAWGLGLEGERAALCPVWHERQAVYGGGGLGLEWAWVERQHVWKTRDWDRPWLVVCARCGAECDTGESFVPRANPDGSVRMLRRP